MNVLTTEKPGKPQTIRLAFTRLAVVPAPPARPIAHPRSHTDTTTRCPACELRDYLEG
jgi:hypothetical protein